MSLRTSVPQRLRPLLRSVRARILSIGLPQRTDVTLSPAECAASTKLSVIIPIHDAPEVTARCLRSLKRFGADAQVILVDDASADPATEWVIKEAMEGTRWLVIRNSSACGHSRSCEAGALAANRPYLCLLNSDTVLTPWSWAAPVEAMETNAEIGIAGPSTSHAATLQTLLRAHYCRHYWSDEQIMAYAGRHLSRIPTRSWLDLPEVGGFAFFIRHQLWKDMSGFDPELMDYGNESELCLRARKQGWRVVWTRNGYIHHLGSQSYGKFARDEPNRRAQLARQYINCKHAATS